MFLIIYVLLAIVINIMRLSLLKVFQKSSKKYAAAALFLKQIISHMFLATTMFP